MREIGRLDVWTNGKTLRKYTGQEKQQKTLASQDSNVEFKYPAGEYFKATALLLADDGHPGSLRAKECSSCNLACTTCAKVHKMWLQRVYGLLEQALGTVQAAQLAFDPRQMPSGLVQNMAKTIANLSAELEAHKE